MLQALMDFKGPFIEPPIPTAIPSWKERLGHQNTNYLMPEESKNLKSLSCDWGWKKSEYKRLSLRKRCCCFPFRKEVKTLAKKRLEAANQLWQGCMESTIKQKLEPRRPSYVTLPSETLANCFLDDKKGIFIGVTALRLKSDPEFALALMDAYHLRTPLDMLDGIFTEYVGQFLPERLKAQKMSHHIPDGSNLPVSV